MYFKNLARILIKSVLTSVDLWYESVKLHVIFIAQCNSIWLIGSLAFVVTLGTLIKIATEILEELTALQLSFEEQLERCWFIE